jgi:hypothetical protein
LRFWKVIPDGSNCFIINMKQLFRETSKSSIFNRARYKRVARWALIQNHMKSHHGLTIRPGKIVYTVQALLTLASSLDGDKPRQWLRRWPCDEMPPPSTIEAKTGDTNAIVSFSVTNTAATNVGIRSIRTSCGCTTAQVPAQPWILPPGGDGQFQLTVDLRGKRGTLNKSITVDSTVGKDLLLLRVQIAEAAAQAQSWRMHHREAALADRQAELKAKRDAAHRTYWRVWTAKGKEGTLMPGFAEAEGGPLSEEQIDSLVDFLSQN